MNVTGITTTSTVAFHLEKLVALGYMTRGPRHRSGTWRVTVPLIIAG